MGGKKDDDELGKHFGKLDIDRVGFFDDPPPTTGPYEEPPLGGAYRDEVKAPQIQPGRRKTYFEHKFSRIFTGEAGADSYKRNQKTKKDPNAATVVPIKPPGYPKRHATPGDGYGCFGPPLGRFDPQERDQPKPERKANLMTRPAPFGGPGYLNYTLNPYIPNTFGPNPYDPEKPAPVPVDARGRFLTKIHPQDYFDSNPYRPVTPEKQPEPTNYKVYREKFHLHFPRPGKNDGCFSKFPAWVSDPEPEPKRTRSKGLRPWKYGTVPITRTKFTTSIVDRVTKVSCNATNYATYTEKVYKIY